MLSRRRRYERHGTSFALIRRTVSSQYINILDFNTCTVEVISRRPKERSVSRVEAAVHAPILPVDNINDTDRLSTLRGNLSKTIQKTEGEKTRMISEAENEFRGESLLLPGNM